MAEVGVLRGEYMEMGKQTTGIPVVIIDDSEGVRLSLAAILKQSKQFTIVGSFADGREAIEGCSRTRPRVALVDVVMPNLSGMECTRRLKTVIPNICVMMVTGKEDDQTIHAAIAAGADGYLAKPFSPEQCVGGIIYALAGGFPLPRGFRERLLAPSAPAVSGAEQSYVTSDDQLMSELARGLLYKEIADRLQTSVAMVRKRLHRIFVHLKVHNKTEALAKWSTKVTPCDGNLEASPAPNSQDRTTLGG